MQSDPPAAQWFDLSADISERNDFSARYPDIVRHLQSARDNRNATLKPPVLDKTVVKNSREK